MTTARRNLGTLADRLAAYDRLVEVGIGRRTELAATLVEAGTAVTATDIGRREVPDGVGFVVDDVVEPDLAVYEDAEAIYARNLPPELHRPTLEVAERVGADFLFTTLGGDQPAVPVERRTVREGTVYVAREFDGPTREDGRSYQGPRE
ncbi:UPF0146 family protein [Natronococcus jeotgali]|uniref:UPF0146 protein C492_03376 n=1 Tax=Natronococcus jeotgali DSM 18795 TaxID=1227498 RepID=L9XUV9_9EURY|nr:UPF0146 family protein [Natronococcus jeotgali]ELY65322.1 hypothetical protein C492_03376 [Natronococcus jeotgali DSM 18795]